MTDAPLADDLRLVESLSKLFAVALGLLYLLGFLVVASYLSRFGVSSFSVLQLQYLLAGIWLLGPPVLHSLILYASRRFDQKAAPDVGGGHFNWRRFAISCLFTGIPFSLFIGLLAIVPNLLQSMTWGMGVRFILFDLLMTNCAVLFWMALQSRPETEKWWLSRSHAAPFYLSFLVMTVLCYAVWFSVRIYPLVPSSLGGGRPLIVVFFEGDKKMPEEIQRTEASTKRSIPYKLLLSTDKYYVVASPSAKERSLEVSRDSVAGMIVLE
jgi:hypothetical protein